MMILYSNRVSWRNGTDGDIEIGVYEQKDHEPAVCKFVKLYFDFFFSLTFSAAVRINNMDINILLSPPYILNSQA